MMLVWFVVLAMMLVPLSCDSNKEGKGPPAPQGGAQEAQAGETPRPGPAPAAPRHASPAPAMPPQTPAAAAHEAEQAGAKPVVIPTPGMVTLVDLGAGKCIPCRMMAPILEELKKEYAGRASVVFIDVWEDKKQAERFKIRAIPTQIFYGKDGKEAGRHTGYLDKKSIEQVFADLGVSKEG